MSPRQRETKIENLLITFLAQTLSNRAMRIAGRERKSLENLERKQPSAIDRKRRLESEV
jgi:cytidylate kinase